MSSKTKKLKMSEMVGGRSGNVFRDTLASLWERGGLALTFPRPFLTTSILGFSSSFLLILLRSSDFDQSATDYYIFTATGDADGDDISPEICSETL